MSHQPAWSIYEAALLIDTYFAIKSRPHERQELISRLSFTLRQLPETQIDETYRNINGIKMRLSEIDCLFNNGTRGLKNTSDLFRQIVNLYNTNQEEYNRILDLAKERVELTKSRSSSSSNTSSHSGTSESNSIILLNQNTATNKEEMMSQKEAFIAWLNGQKNIKYQTSQIIRSMDEASAFVIEHGLSKKNIWDMDSRVEFSNLFNKLSGMRLFHRSLRKSSKLFIKISRYYKVFLDDYCNKKARQTDQATPSSSIVHAMPVIVNDDNDLSNDEKENHSLPQITETADEQVDQNPHIEECISQAAETVFDFDDTFYNWLFSVEGMAIRTCHSYVSALHRAEEYARDNGLGCDVICTINCENARKTISLLMAYEGFQGFNRTQHNRFSAAFQKLFKFYEYLGKESTTPIWINSSSNSPKPDKKPIESIPSELVEGIDKLLRENSDTGLSKNTIIENYSNYGTHQINLALEKCHAVLILKKYYHRDCISDYQDMADILLDVISRQFSQNGNYTSAQQLYNEARPRLDDFFFYNNAFDSRQEVYDLAVHLFEQERYKENSFIFMNNMHIWKEEPDYPKDYHGLMIKYAREHENTFTREDAVAYFEQIGSTTPAATFSNVIFNTGNKSFLQYAENQFVLTEAIHINDYFLASLASQIENLLEGEDYIATGEIDDYFYTTLPALPSGIFWSALLLEDVLRIYETGFTTIEAGKDNDKKTVPAAIVRKKSHYRSFSDVVWNEVSKSFHLPKEFTASEFREFLLNKGFIRGSEKMWSVHKTVAGDIRFYWTDNNGRVTIN